MKSAQFIAKFEREHLNKGETGLQERKSAETRLIILDAAMDCLAKYGYARTTTQLICRIAHISRGAMLHHYPSKADLIKAVIDYTFYKRMTGLVESVKQLSERERLELNLGIKNFWQQLASREYQVYLELHVAARSDPELRDLFMPRARQYDQIWRENIAPLYPEWSDRRMYDLGSEFARSMLEGLKLNSDIWNNPDNETVLVEFATQLLIMLRDGRLRFPVNGSGASASRAKSAKNRQTTATG